MASATDVLDLARSQIGVSSPDNRTPYNLEYGLSGPGAAWCQMFVWWCLSHSGVETIRTAWTPSGIAYYEGLGRWTQGGCLDGAEPGDVIYFDYDNFTGQRTDHVGLIEAVGGGYVQTIEGNVGGGVKRLWHKLCAGYIVGYGRPLYDGAPANNSWTPPAPVTVDDPKVRAIQTLLTNCGIDDVGGVDGQLGPKTKAGIAEWQRRLGIAADGEWGPQTQRSTDQFFDWIASNNMPTPPPAPTEQVDLSALAAAINDAKRQVLRSGSTGDAVKWLQIALNNRGAGLAVDGAFGPATDSAVRAFQRSNGLSADGICGPQTWNRLVP
jgi:peptidoglycan hydrolase-like protein with peptidoglycan-binding domain